MDGYLEKRDRIARDIHTAAGGVRLEKSTSNLFRDREAGGSKPLKASDFDQVISVDSEQSTIEVEGMTPYSRLVDHTLPHGIMPAVVPQLKSITIGGAVSGIGIESSSFRYGLPHETVEEMDVLLPDGTVVTCSRENEHKELFYGLPNSYGTLGYILRLRILGVAVKPYVELIHTRITDPGSYFRAVGDACRSDVDFVDGTVFSEGEHYLTTGRFVDDVPYVSDYTWLNIYYRSIRDRRQDYLTVRDYIWRWDTDWFWCSKNLYVQNPLMRRILGRKYLNSVTYTRVMRWNTRVGLTRRLNAMVGNRPESVIQDVDIPIENAPEFLAFFQSEIGIKPVWICPIGHYDPNADFPLYPLRGDGLYINFGFWDVVKNRKRLEKGHFNRMIEKKVQELGGVKSLYSDSYFPQSEFWSIYNEEKYRALKRQYDPDNRLKDLYQKTVLRQ